MEIEEFLSEKIMQFYDVWVENPGYQLYDEWIEEQEEELKLEEIDNQINILNLKENNMSDKKEITMNEAFIAASLDFEPLTFNKKVKYGSTNFDYADLSEIIRCVQKPLLNNGFIILHELTYESDKVWLKTTIKYKTNEIFAQSIYPIDITNKKMQEIGSQITYIKRYQLAAMCCVNADADNDALEIKDQMLNKTIEEHEISTLNDYLSKLDSVERSTVYRAIRTNNLSKLTKNQYPNVLKYVRNFIEKKQKEKDEGRNSGVLSANE